jgi:hypothetical protein
MTPRGKEIVAKFHMKLPELIAKPANISLDRGSAPCAAKSQMDVQVS